MDLRPTATGRWQLRWREHGQRRARTFDRKEDAEEFEVTRRRRRQLGRPAIEADVTFDALIVDYWRDHGLTLADSTQDVYLRVWRNHLLERIGHVGVREFTPRRARALMRELDRDSAIGAATVRKSLALLGSVLQYAVAEERLELNVLRGMTKPDYDREREPMIFQPADVERIRAQLPPRDALLVAVLAYAGPRPEEALRLRGADIGAHALHFIDTKRHRERWTPLVAALRDDIEEYGPVGKLEPLFPAHDGGFFQIDDYRNWRRRVWGAREQLPGGARGGRLYTPEGSRPRDLRSSYVTVQVYAGVPLTTIARDVGTSLAMLDRHYAGIVANWDGRQVPADEQIAVARARRMEVVAASG